MDNKYKYLLCTAVCSAYPNMKRSSEVVQIGLNETNVFQTKFSATTLGSEQGLFFVLDEDDLDYRQTIKLTPLQSSAFSDDLD